MKPYGKFRNPGDEFSMLQELNLSSVLQSMDASFGPNWLAFRSHSRNPKVSITLGGRVT